MDSIPIKVKEYKEKPRQGVVEGKHLLVECSNCRKLLADIWVNRPHAKRPDGQPFKWTVRAECCWCGDSSFPVEYEGIAHIGPYGKDDPDDPESSHIETDHIDLILDEDNNLVIIKTAPRRKE